MTEATTTTIAEQVAARWNGETGQHWVDDADGFDALLEPLGREVLAAARLQPGERVLEVGSGTGQMALQAALVAPSGSVLGVDVSVPMTERARRRAAAAGIANVRFMVADAAGADLPEASFDVLVSRFGVMFFADPAAAFAHLVRRLKPGGRIAFVVWQEMQRSDLFAIPAAAIARLAPEAVVPPMPGAPGPFSLSDPARLEALLVGAGAGDVRVDRLQRRLRAGRDIGEAIAFIMRSSPLDAVRTGEASIRQQVERELRRLLADHTGPAGVELSGAAWLVSARRPPSNSSVT